MSELSAVKDLAVGAVIHLAGFEEPLTVQAAKKIKKGLDAGKLVVTLVTAEGETERVALPPDEKVKIVQATPAAAEPPSAAGKSAAKPGKGKAKKKAPAQTEDKPTTPPAAQSQTPPAPAAASEATAAPGDANQAASGSSSAPWMQPTRS
jgi:hypothetical protein